MPCETLSAARSYEDGGPVPIHGECAPEIFGLKGLSYLDKQKVAMGTLLALRGAEMANLFCGIGRSFWGETPGERMGRPQVFKLPDWLELAAREGVDKSGLVQCELGARTSKAIDTMHYRTRISFPTECTHQK